MDDRALLAVMDKNLCIHMSWLQARIPGARVLDDSALLLVDCGLPTDTFNCVLRARFSPDTAARGIDAALSHFQRAGRPFSWWLGPLDTPGDLGQSLERAGLSFAEGELAMIAALADVPEVHTGPNGLRIERVTTLRGVADFAHVLAMNWSPPDAEVLRYYEMGTPFLLGPSSPIRLYVGYRDGRPVAASECCVAADAAGLYSVCTLGTERRKGYGTAMTARPLHEARAEGITHAVLQASEQGALVYPRLGFRTIGHYVEYKPPAP